MVDVLIAHDTVEIDDSQVAVQHIFEDTVGANLLVDEVVWIEVEEAESQIAGNGSVKKVYDLTMAYFAGTPGTIVAAEIRRAETDPSTTPVLRASFNQFGATSIGMNLMAIENENDKVRYNVFNWSFGAASGVLTNIHSQRVVRDTINRSAIAAVTGITTLIENKTIKVSTASDIDVYDVFT